MTKPSLRTELLLAFGVLGAAALAIAVLCVLAFAPVAASPDTPYWVSALVAADVVVLLAAASYYLRRLVLRPLDGVVAATEAIAGGDLARRAGRAETRELDALAASVNRMTDRLLDGQRQLARAETLASVGRLAAGLAHEIGNPLAAIGGYAHVLGRVSGSHADARDAVIGIEREVSRIDRIVRGLLDYARPRRVTPAPLDVNVAVEEALSLLDDQGVLKRIEVTCALDPDSPRIFGERHDLVQVFVNLFLNAADAMNGEGRLTIHTRRFARETLEQAPPRRAGDPPRTVVPRPRHPRVAAWLAAAPRPPEVVKVVVADAGPGIPPAHEERVFEPFYTTKEPGKGTGLGLAIVARTVENLGGAVWVSRAREGGAAFHLLFPLAAAVTAASLPPPRRAAAHA
ncbi:MAG TPA: ATP-binding protein [Gemmatimonadaceae bacterium]|nr:ATP-binding protein [Gemmatimonadaceae bacterium]